MKKFLCFLLAALLLLSACGTAEPAPAVPPESEAAPSAQEDVTTPPATEAVPEAPTEPVPSETEPPEAPEPALPDYEVHVCEDGRDRPSSCGNLQVVDGKLCSQTGEPVMLRGVSSYGLPMADGFVNQETFAELSHDFGANVFRLAMYTWGVGTVGYCTGGHPEELRELMKTGVALAHAEDLYAIVDWHILQDGDPNTYLEESKAFFAEMSEVFKDCDNVLYEICNEPNGCTWADIKAYAEVIIPIIREHDPDSVIIVGTPNWSQRVDEAAADPLDFDNILYTLHFYSASHKDELRDPARQASQAGLPIFVTEYGVTSSSGGFPRDLEEADRWIEMLEEENISYCMWSYSKVAEPCSAIRHTVPYYHGFQPEDFTDTGTWLLDTLRKHQ